MRCFENIAKLIKTKRLSHPQSYSQSELSNLLGYKNGQFISNVERALCNIPFKMLTKVSTILNIETVELKTAILKDCEMTVDNYFATPALSTEVNHYATTSNIVEMRPNETTPTTPTTEESTFTPTPNTTAVGQA